MARLVRHHVSCVALSVLVHTNWWLKNLILRRSFVLARLPRRSGAHAAPERVVMLRGVVWRTAEVELWPLWRDMARCWPTALVDGGGPGSQLLAHAGERKSRNSRDPWYCCIGCAHQRVIKRAFCVRACTACSATLEEQCGCRRGRHGPAAVGGPAAARGSRAAARPGHQPGRPQAGLLCLGALQIMCTALPCSIQTHWQPSQTPMGHSKPWSRHLT